MNPSRMLLCCLTGLAVTPLHAAKVEPARFPFVKDLVATAPAPAAMAAAELDEQILAGTDSTFANLRIFDASGGEVPCLVRTRQVNRSETRETELAMETLSLETLPDNSIRILLRKKTTGEDRFPSAVVFHTALRDFEKQVTILGSMDGNEWTPLAERRPIFDYSRFLDVRNTRVDFAPGPYREFRIVVSNITENSMSPLVQIARTRKGGDELSETERTAFHRSIFRIERMQFFDRREVGVRAEPVKRAYTADSVSVTNDEKNNATVVEFRSPRAPLTEIAVQVTDRNFSRSCRIEGSDEETGDQGWRVLANERLTRVEAGEFRLDRTKVLLPGSLRFPRYRLTVENQDSPPLSIAGLTTRGLVDELVCLADRPRPYKVYYGGLDVPSPRYDIGAVLRNAETAAMEPFTLGRQLDNPAYRGPGSLPAASGRRLLTGAIVVMVLALAAIIVKSARKV